MIQFSLAFAPYVEGWDSPSADGAELKMSLNINQKREDQLVGQLQYSKNRRSMINLSSLMLIFAFSIVVSASDTTQPQTRQDKEIEGWTVRIDSRLFEPEHLDLQNQATRFLEAKLFEIKQVVPAERLKDLQRVKIVLDLECGKLESMQYHPSGDWLKSNGYSEELAKCVHLPKAVDIATIRNIREQPWVILHELAHAYHDQILGFDHPKVKAAFESYKQSGRGSQTLLYSGDRVEHYALTNEMEFFAEMTESFFGTNDFYPFNRAELKESEPEIHALMNQIWMVE